MLAVKVKEEETFEKIYFPSLQEKSMARASPEALTRASARASAE